MAMERDSFVFYRSYVEALKELPDASRLRVMDAILSYAIDGEESNLTGFEKAVFVLIKPQIKANNQRYENGCKGAEYGAKGGRPKKTTAESKPQNETEETPKKPQENPTETPNENENENENENVDIRSVGLNAGVGAREDVEEQTAEYRAFMEEHPKIVADITNPSLVGTVDFALLSEKIAESGFLQTRYSLSWLISNYRKIVSDGYRDYRRAPPKEEGDAQLQYLRELYEEAKEEDRRNAEKRSS